MDDLKSKIKTICLIFIFAVVTMIFGYATRESVWNIIAGFCSVYGIIRYIVNL